MEKMIIWNATYRNGVMPVTQVMGYTDKDARAAAVAAYRFHSHMSASKLANDVVEKIEQAADQGRFGGIFVQPCSEFPPDKPVVNTGDETEAV